MKALILIFLGILPITGEAARKMASIPVEIRVGHARELLGRGYKKSVVSRAENQKGLAARVLATVERRLPKAYKKQAHLISNTIIEEATRHGLDPYFVMAVIAGESSFNPKARGPVGEIGLMQIRPTTGKWIAQLKELPWKSEATLKDPIQNIRLGTAYLAWLREKFNGHGQLYLAAYNMGPKSVKRALDRKIWPKDYPRHVMKRYVAFYRELSANL